MRTLLNSLSKMVSLPVLPSIPRAQHNPTYIFTKIKGEIILNCKFFLTDTNWQRVGTLNPQEDNLDLSPVRREEMDNFLQKLEDVAQNYHMSEGQVSEWREFLQRKLESPQWDPTNLPSPSAAPSASTIIAPAVPALVLTPPFFGNPKPGMKKDGKVTKGNWVVAQSEGQKILGIASSTTLNSVTINHWKIEQGKISRTEQESTVGTTSILAANFTLNLNGTLPSEIRKIMNRE